ncbi:Asp23/Gls24 family envelope stress response protein [Microbacterium oxydans]|uniref:Asp23/Gls24 family envelope stress response protein n=1 Tax=Microbacterium oxydans TaxID=82380 RepID=UPI001141C363|nr:Asp23/Gls24 family envelope stress response protein [Microbacterium oxydans]KAB1889529.1 Asp23/Gls24 family envelope stress response protein [Microbacterium oxydans]
MANTTPGTQPEIHVEAPLQGAAVGTTTIEDAVVAKIAGIAARDVDGVHALGGGAARMVGAIRDAFNTTDLSQGVSVAVGEAQITVDITIVAEYPVALQKVADEVRAAIHRDLVELAGADLVEVNVTIDDVHVPSDDVEGETAVTASE